MITLIPWIGGKGKLLPVIQELLPTQYTRFVDVFGGGGTVTLNLPMRKGVERIYNDINSNLTNLMTVVRDQPIEFVQELGFLPLHSRDEFNVLCKFLNREEFTDEYMERQMELVDRYFEPPDAAILKEILLKHSKLHDVPRAAAFFITQRGSFSGTGSSFGARPCNLRQAFHQIWKGTERLQDVVIENKDFEDVVAQHDGKNAMLYFDPPYVEAEEYYDVEFGLKEHQRLNALFKRLEGFGMLSYNKCDPILDLYQDFYIFQADRQDSLSQTEGKRYEELIITNYDPRDCGMQMRLELPDTSGAGYWFIHEPKNKHFIKIWR